jgi:hypothetical protein
VLYFRPSSRNWATPSVLLTIGDDEDADGLPTVQEKVSPTENIIGLSYFTFIFVSTSFAPNNFSCFSTF